MIDALIAINGKSGSGKDMYANAIRNYLSNYSVKYENNHCSLQFAMPLKTFTSSLTDIPFEYFIKRKLKDALLPEEVQEAMLNKLQKLSSFRSLAYPMAYSPDCMQADKLLFHKILFHAELDIQYIIEAIGTLGERFSPRDLLKLFGAYGGIVPFWSWFAATMQHTEFYYNAPEDYIVIISDLRTIEEYTSLLGYCESRKIPLITFQLEHWNKEAKTCNHITEVDLDNKEQFFTKIFSPKKGEQEKCRVLSNMLEILLDRIEEDKIIINAASIQSAILDATNGLKEQ